jgi:hypothetical protein
MDGFTNYLYISWRLKPHFFCITLHFYLNIRLLGELPLQFKILDEPLENVHEVLLLTLQFEWFYYISLSEIGPHWYYPQRSRSSCKSTSLPWFLPHSGIQIFEFLVSIKVPTGLPPGCSSIPSASWVRSGYGS